MRYRSWWLLGLLYGLVYLGGQAQPLVVQAFPNLTFNLAVDLQNAGDGTNRLFAVEQPGVIKVFENDPDVQQANVFLDIRSRVLSDDRFGMLGMAFHPDYENNGFFYVHYTASGPQRSIISRFSVSDGNPNQADPSSELVLIEAGQPHKFHNGGQLAFGPDGYLYIGFGDGGPGRDPNGHGQNRRTLLGAFLRIDVDAPSDSLPYGIPADNPFVGNSDGFREEIWAWGFRNPWRFSFDPATGALWTADNGEDRFEEINIVEKGNNYGWKIMEASACFSPPSGCNQTDLTLPVFEYGGNSSRRSVIGGYVYHGERHESLQGKYIYGDFLLSSIWSLELNEAGQAVNQTLVNGSAGGIGTFGLDEAGELYHSNLFDGKIYRLSEDAF